MRAAVLVRLLGKERRVNAAEDDPRAALARHAADLVAAQRVAGVDADADDVAGARSCRHVERARAFRRR